MRRLLFMRQLIRSGDNTYRVGCHWINTTSGVVFVLAQVISSVASWTQIGGSSQAFPVGSVFISVVSTNPGTLLGYGTWVAFGAGRMLVGIGAGQTEFDTVEEVGGAKTVTLDATMIPAHTHGVTDPGHNHTQNAHNHGVTDGGHSHTERVTNSGTAGLVGVQGASTATHSATTSPETTASATTGITVNNATATNNSATTGITIQNAGGGGAHSNLPPYIVCYFWKRTA